MRGRIGLAPRLAGSLAAPEVSARELAAHCVRAGWTPAETHFDPRYLACGSVTCGGLCPVGLAVTRVLEALLRDERVALTVTRRLQDYHGVSGVCLSIP
jgi:hypothetical protein